MSGVCFSFSRLKCFCGQSAWLFGGIWSFSSLYSFYIYTWEVPLVASFYSHSAFDSSHFTIWGSFGIFFSNATDFLKIILISISFLAFDGEASMISAGTDTLYFIIVALLSWRKKYIRAKKMILFVFF